MDIHPPEHPIRSVRDFLVQMFTVTCGIIIALGLEALVTWRSDASLASVTRADFRAEISENLANLEQVKPGMQSDFADRRPQFHIAAEICVGYGTCDAGDPSSAVCGSEAACQHV
jgi:hypothetical protein